MNRLKFWLFALVVLAVAASGMRWLAADLRKQAIDGIDRQLLAAQARAETAERTLTADLASVAALAAQDDRLAAALHASLPAAEPAPAARPRRSAQTPPAPNPDQLDAAVDQAAAEAVSAAQALLGAAQPGREVRAASREGFQRRPPADADAAAFLQDALDHRVRRGYAILGGKLYAGAGVPLGDRGALAVFAPVDATWAAAAVAGTGTALVLVAPGQKPVASSRQPEAEALARSASNALAPRDAGRLAPLDVSPAWLRMQLPKVSSFLGPLPADRVVARPLAGVKGGQMVLALATRPVLGPLVALEWYGAAALALLLLLALIFGFLIKPTEVAAPVPSALLDAARKIEKGDFSVRAPVMAGKVGTVAAALNAAAEAAQAGAGPGASASEPGGSLTSEFFAKAPPEPAEPFAMPVRGPRGAPVGEPRPAETRAVSDTARLDGANLTGAAFEAAPMAAPRPAPAPVRPPVPAPAPPVAAAVPSTPELLPAARAAPAGEGADEEQHWREVFRDFVRTRGECGESAEGLTYERFRQKLESNKGALVAKYGCKTVRFQVYVKDGKAALKATPVR
jgi:hypothetical protein